MWFGLAQFSNAALQCQFFVADIVNNYVKYDILSKKKRITLTLIPSCLLVA